MPSKDIFHESVRNALEKDGWIITHDPLYPSSMTLGNAKFEMFI